MTSDLAFRVCCPSQLFFVLLELPLADTCEDIFSENAWISRSSGGSSTSWSRSSRTPHRVVLFVLTASLLALLLVVTVVFAFSRRSSFRLRKRAAAGKFGALCANPRHGQWNSKDSSPLQARTRARTVPRNLCSTCTAGSVIEPAQLRIDTLRYRACACPMAALLRLHALLGLL